MANRTNSRSSASSRSSRSSGSSTSSTSSGNSRSSGSSNSQTTESVSPSSMAFDVNAQGGSGRLSTTIMTKIALFGRAPIEFTAKRGQTVKEILDMADITTQDGEEIRLNGAVAQLDTRVTTNNSLITAVPNIRGG